MVSTKDYLPLLSCIYIFSKSWPLLLIYLKVMLLVCQYYCTCILIRSIFQYTVLIHGSINAPINVKLQGGGGREKKATSCLQLHCTADPDSNNIICIKLISKYCTGHNIIIILLNISNLIMDKNGFFLTWRITTAWPVNFRFSLQTQIILHFSMLFFLYLFL